MGSRKYNFANIDTDGQAVSMKWSGTVLDMGCGDVFLLRSNGENKNGWS